MRTVAQSPEPPLTRDPDECRSPCSVQTSMRRWRGATAHTAYRRCPCRSKAGASCLLIHMQARRILLPCATATLIHAPFRPEIGHFISSQLINAVGASQHDVKCPSPVAPPNSAPDKIATQHLQHLLLRNHELCIPQQIGQTLLQRLATVLGSPSI